MGARLKIIVRLLKTHLFLLAVTDKFPAAPAYSSVSYFKDLGRDIPQITKSILPNLSTVACTALLRASGSLTSAEAARHFAPVVFSKRLALSSSPLALIDGELNVRNRRHDQLTLFRQSLRLLRGASSIL